MAAFALKQFLARCHKHGTQVIFSGAQEQPRRLLLDQGIAAAPNLLGWADGFDEALAMARIALAAPEPASPAA